MLVKILAVFLCGTPVVWLMSLLYCSASGTDLPHGLFKVYGVLYRAPGAPPPPTPLRPAPLMQPCVQIAPAAAALRPCIQHTAVLICLGCVSHRRFGNIDSPRTIFRESSRILKPARLLRCR